MNKTYILGNTKLTKWENENGMTSFTMEKSYKDKEGVWQPTKSFGNSELAKLKVLIDEALHDDIKVFENNK